MRSRLLPQNRRAVTLIELLITVVISSIALMALAVPFVAGRSFLSTGKRQTEAQRDAQVALRAMAKVMREGTSYDASVTDQLSFRTPDCPAGIDSLFERTGDALRLQDCFGNEAVLIDGVRSKVVEFTPTEIIADKLVRIRLHVTHQLRQTDPRTQDEVLETDLLLRNGPA